MRALVESRPGTCRYGVDGVTDRGFKPVQSSVLASRVVAILNQVPFKHHLEASFFQPRMPITS